jgi:hypothetical protein
MIKSALSQSPNKVNLHPLSSKIVTFVLLVAEAVIPLMLLLVTSQLAPFSYSPAVCTTVQVEKTEESSLHQLIDLL